MSRVLKYVLANIAAVVIIAASALSQTASTLYSFTGGADGGDPESQLMFDARGNLYGTTTAGGAHGEGAVFELTPSASGYTESVIYSFEGSADGNFPAAGLIHDQKGNLYGTLYYGGADGHGAVFELSRSGSSWTKTMLYSFVGALDGGQPASGLIMDRSGNLYGVTSLDGAYGQGVVFELSPSADGTWTESVLHAFVSQTTSDGQGPSGPLVIDQAGNLYGMTVQGGTNDLGTVYKLSPNGDGTWTESLIYSFQGTDGANPARSNLTLGPAGSLFGTTTSGGAANEGVVFQLFPSQTGKWRERVLFSFPGGANGGNPFAGVIRDPAGNLYGTTASGVFGAGGVVYKLTKTGGQWSEEVLYTVDNPGNGSYANLVRDAAGNLYGTTEFGGSAFAGDIFKVTP